MAMRVRLNIAVVGSGISGLSAAWHLSQQGHSVTLYERERRCGGHSNTVEIDTSDGRRAVDTGFIVYNTPAYPNLTALFAELGVETAPAAMGFAVSLDDGRYEYSGNSPATLFGQPSNLLSASHWRMIGDILRFFREARRDQDGIAERVTLGEFLVERGYSSGFIDRHIVPMAAAIWSTPALDVLDFPAAAFFRFFANHGLLSVTGRPIWRTVTGGSRNYVDRIIASIGNDNVVTGQAVSRVGADGSTAVVETLSGERRRFDQVVIATHADEALRLIDQPSSAERALLGSFRYAANTAILHRDAGLMPKRQRVWASWNYLGASGTRSPTPVSLTYWMNALQPLDTRENIFISLNPARDVTAGTEIARFDYRHPVFDPTAMQAQRKLWSLQGEHRRWFCGSYFGYGFHEDGLQSGLAVAEQLGGGRRPWTVANPSSRVLALNGPPALVWPAEA